MMSSDTGLIHFDDVRVPQRNRIGEEGMGFTYQMMQFQEERLWAAAHAIQALLNCIEQTVDYARERQIFGKSVLDHQVVHFKLAELKTEVEALRALIYMATETVRRRRQDVTEWASMAKLKAGRLGRDRARRLPAVLGRHGLHLGEPGLAPCTATAASARSAAAPTR